MMMVNRHGVTELFFRGLHASPTFEDGLYTYSCSVTHTHPEVVLFSFCCEVYFIGEKKEQPEGFGNGWSNSYPNMNEK